MKSFTTLAFFGALVASQKTGEAAPKATRDPRIPKLADFGKVPIPFGPAPKGCSKYELIIGMTSHLLLQKPSPNTKLIGVE
jgi:hypothetical protein